MIVPSERVLFADLEKQIEPEITEDVESKDVDAPAYIHLFNGPLTKKEDWFG